VRNRAVSAGEGGIRACASGRRAKAAHGFLLSLLRLSSRWWGYVEGQHPNLPGIALTNINRSPIALELYRTTALALKSKTPFPGPPDLTASCSYHVRGTLIVLVEMVAVMPLLEHPAKSFDGLPTENMSLRSHLNRVLGVKRGQGSGITVIECLVKLLSNLLVYLSIDRVFLLGEGRQGKDD
jgi:hypothetical protein